MIIVISQSNVAGCNVKPVFVDVAQKLRKRYYNISQTQYEVVIYRLVS